MARLELDDRTRLMVVAPHPDDEAIATGGLLQAAVAAGAVVRVVLLTDGNNNPWPQRVIERRLRIDAEGRARWGARRRKEAEDSLRCLGVPADAARFLAFPDQGLTDHLLAGAAELTRHLADEITRFRPSLLVSPSLSDLHPDHSAAAVAIAALLDRPDALPRVPQHLHYVVHTRPTAMCNDQRTGLTLALSPQQVRVKREAILCHRTQVRLFPNRFLAHATCAEHFVAEPTPGPAGPARLCRPARRVTEGLCFDLSLHACTGSFGPATLLLIPLHDGVMGPPSRVAWSPGRRRRSILCPIHDVATGGVTGRAICRGTRRGGELILPPGSQVGVGRWFVKIERRFGFFDEAGWWEFLAPRPE